MHVTSSHVLVIRLDFHQMIWTGLLIIFGQLPSNSLSCSERIYFLVFTKTFNLWSREETDRTDLTLFCSHPLDFGIEMPSHSLLFTGRQVTLSEPSPRECQQTEIMELGITA